MPEVNSPELRAHRRRSPSWTASPKKASERCSQRQIEELHKPLWHIFHFWLFEGWLVINGHHVYDMSPIFIHSHYISHISGWLILHVPYYSPNWNQSTLLGFFWISSGLRTKCLIHEGFWWFLFDCFMLTRLLLWLFALLSPFTHTFRHAHTHTPSVCIHGYIGYIVCILQLLTVPFACLVA